MGALPVAASCCLHALLRATVVATLALGLAWLACRLVRPSPRSQIWLWRLAFIKLLLVLAWDALGLGELGTGPAHTGLLAVDYLALALVTLWLGGVGLALARLVGERRRTTALRRRSEPIPELATAFTEAARSLGLRRVPGLAMVDDLLSPVAIGAFRPLVLVPRRLVADTPRDRLLLLLRHELAHVRRHDLLWAWLPSLASLACFFHPLAWVAAREWRRAQELVADELALASSDAPPAHLAEALLGVLARAQGQGRQRLAGLASASTYAELELRIEAMFGRRARPPRRRRRAAFGLVALGLLLLLPWIPTLRLVSPGSGWIRAVQQFDGCFLRDLGGGCPTGAANH